MLALHLFLTFTSSTTAFTVAPILHSNGQRQVLHRREKFSHSISSCSSLRLLEDRNGIIDIPAITTADVDHEKHRGDGIDDMNVVDKFRESIGSISEERVMFQSEVGGESIRLFR